MLVRNQPGDEVSDEAGNDQDRGSTHGDELHRRPAPSPWRPVAGLPLGEGHQVRPELLQKLDPRVHAIVSCCVGSRTWSSSSPLRRRSPLLTRALATCSVHESILATSAY